MNLQDKAVKIKGKDYVLVKDRVLHFNEHFKDGCIQTELLSDCASDLVVVKATVMPDCSKPNCVFTGHAQEIVGDGFINKTSALENAETSAVGRALAMLGIGVIDSIASVDEIKKAENRSSRGMTEGQMSKIMSIITGKEGEVTEFLFKKGLIKNKEDWTAIDYNYAQRIINKPDMFMSAVKDGE